MKRLTSAFLLLILMLSFSSCEAKEPSVGAYYTFTDATGATVTLDERPLRVAVLFSSFADIWVTAGGTVDITVGEAVERGFAPETAVLVDAGSGHTAIDTERLIAEEPDLVIATADYAHQVDACELLRSFGIPAAAMRVESPEDYLSVLRIFTDILGTQERFYEFGTKMLDRIAEIRTESQKIYENESMLFIRAGTSQRSVKAKRGEDHFACAMIEELGFRNVAQTGSPLIDGLSLEAVVELDPSYIFVTFMGDERAARAFVTELLSGEGYSTLTAVKEGRVIFLPKEYFHYKPCSRWASAYEYVISELERSRE